jgi:hypothetical protein
VPRTVRVVEPDELAGPDDPEDDPEPVDPAPANPGDDPVDPDV